MTPMMRQYLKIKEQYNDCILFYRLGDFYEMFFGDAIAASKMLEIALTGRDCGESQKAPMCGVPVHSADVYIAKLVEKGHRVAICEQIEDASSNKGLVKREVVRIVTRGTIMDQNVLDAGKNNFLCSLYVDEAGIGVAFVDITTGELDISENGAQNIEAYIMNQLALYSPTEVIANSELCAKNSLVKQIRGQFGCSLSHFSEFSYANEDAKKLIEDHFGKDLENLGLVCKFRSTLALGALILYLEHTQKTKLSGLNKINDTGRSDNVKLDIYTLRNLELFENISGNNALATLFGVINKTKTPMGSRLLQNWLKNPLTNLVKIQNRLDAVSELIENQSVLRQLGSKLDNIVDISRIVSKLSCKTGSGKELIVLAKSLEPLPDILESMSFLESRLFRDMQKQFDLLEDVRTVIQNAIAEEAPAAVTEGDIIKAGYSKEVDDRRLIIKRGVHWINELAKTEREKLGVKIKVGHNRVFGYYLEVGRADSDKVPNYFIRRQTTSNSERYVTQEIKSIENKIIEAESIIINLEYEIFCDVKSKVVGAINRILNTAQMVAQIDVLCAFASIAIANDYVCPYVNLSDRIIIKDGRHPVVERTMKDKLFIPNDISMDGEDNQIYIITGPNMAGKSTYMRQTVLIVLMAQIGCFVPAGSAEIGIVENIFTRVGASDDLSMGQSTFMVEMSEVAYILNLANSRSLIVLDEVGRGTSTQDGLSIAWAIVEYIADQKKCGAKTLFSTHYHELTEIENKIPCVRNYCVATKRSGDNITFLRKIVRGKVNESYGIEVAKLAGVHKDVIKRAKEILKALNDGDPLTFEAKNKSMNVDGCNEQMVFFSSAMSVALQELNNLDMDGMSHEDAFNKLLQICSAVKNAY